LSIPNALETSAPGRICLFGEHQDYLGLPVIAMAIDLRITVKGRRIAGDIWKIRLIDIDKTFDYNPNKKFAYRFGRDYLPAASNVLLRDFGVKWPYSYEIEICGNIPINSGASSSSALQVAWCAFLLAAAGDARATDASFVARIANLSEVCEFGSPGGVMDHETSAHGGLVWIDTRTPVTVEKLGAAPQQFVLIDSGISKDTNGVLGDRRKLAETGLAYLKQKYSAADCKSVWDCACEADVAAVKQECGDEAALVLHGNIANRKLCAAARQIMCFADSVGITPQIGSMLTAHHLHLSNEIGVSHPFIDEVLLEARNLGGVGGKINGSGCGGSFYTLVPPSSRLVDEMLERRSLRYWRIACGEGLKVRIDE